jgi:hypothetical protein
MRVITCLAICTLVICAAASGQIRERPCGDGAGVLIGTVTNAESGQLVERAGVVLERDSTQRPCATSLSPAGKFTFSGLHAGEVRLQVSTRGFRPQRIAIHMSTADTQRVEISLLPGTVLDDCHESPACKEWVTVPLGGSGSEQEALETLAFQTAAILALKDYSRPLEAYFCLPEDASTSVMTSMMARHTRTVRAAECASVQTDSGPQPRTRLRHVASGMPAYSLRAQRVESSSPTTRVYMLSHYVASLWAEGWRCTFQLAGQDWIAKACTMEWIS